MEILKSCEVCGTQSHYLRNLQFNEVTKQVCDKCRVVYYKNPDVFKWVLIMLSKIPKKTRFADSM